MGGPVRVQLSRRKGWRMPENTVSVARPTKWGNPYPVSAPGRWHPMGLTRESAVAAFRNCALDRFPEGFDAIRGKNLACWCPLNQPCHADVLLELANKEPCP